MLFHYFVLVLMLGAVSAFLILWYFTVKRKIQTLPDIDSDDYPVFPFRHFSWLLLGLLVLTCLAQVHFLRASAKVHESVTRFTELKREQEQSTEQLAQLKVHLESLRDEMKMSFTRLQAHQREQIEAGMAQRLSSDPLTSPRQNSRPATVARLHSAETGSRGRQFAAEARASSAALSKQKKPHRTTKRKQSAPKGLEGKNRAVQRQKKVAPTQPKKKTRETRAADTRPGGKPAHPPRVWSMRLDLLGHASVDKLAVRERPHRKAPIIDKLAAGQQVKVTEKRLINEHMWYCVITPDGLAGWVDFRFMKLLIGREQAST